jgi:ClpP class serine protease
MSRTDNLKGGPFRPKIRNGELLAIERNALEVDFSYQSNAASHDYRTPAGIQVINVQGPLEHHAGWCWDSYESIVKRVHEAMSGKKSGAEGSDASAKPEPARAVILRIDSPGGEAAGTMSMHRKLRKMRAHYDVPLLAYSDELAASAAYALASAADEIWLPDTGVVGSVGVIATLFDRTAQNEQFGLHVELVTSGKYKADNHADRPLDDGIRGRVQSRVLDMADKFWQIVADARGSDAKSVSKLEAATFMGKRAVAAGLADGVLDWDAFLTLVKKSLDTNEESAASAA